MQQILKFKKFYNIFTTLTDQLSKQLEINFLSIKLNDTSTKSLQLHKLCCLFWFSVFEFKIFHFRNRI